MTFIILKTQICDKNLRAKRRGYKRAPGFAWCILSVSTGFKLNFIKER